MENNNLQKYELSQNGRNYLLTSEILEDYVRITCVETGVLNPPIFFGEFTLAYLQQLSKVFDTISTIAQAQEIINQTIEIQKVSIEHKKDIINITLYLQRESESESSSNIVINETNNKAENIANSQPLVYNKVENVTTKTIYKQGTTNNNISIPTQFATSPEVYTTTTTTTTTTNENYNNYDNNQNNINYDANNKYENINYESNQKYENVNYENNQNYEITNQNYEITKNYEINNQNYENYEINNQNYEINQNQNYETTQNYESYQNYDNLVQAETNPYDTTLTTSVDELNIPLNVNTNSQVETYNTSVTSGVEEVTYPLNINENTQTQIETNTTNTYTTTVTPKIQSFTLPLTSIIEPNTNIDYVTQTQTENRTTHYEPQNHTPYVTPTVVQPHITYQTIITPPKREQIQYTVPNSKITYSTINPETFHQQKIVETTKTTTKQYNPTPVQIPQPQIDMTVYNEKITKLQTETNKIRGEYDILKNEANKLRGEVEQLRSQNTILLEENKSLRQNNGSMPSQAQIHEITILKQENERLKKQLEQYISIETTFEQYKRLKEQEINYLKLQIEGYIKNQQKLEEIILLKQREIDELKFQIQQLIKNVNISESQNYIMRQQQQQKGGSGSQTLTIQDTRMEIVKGEIIKSSAELELLTRKICQNYQKVTLDLLYKATIDSDKAAAFHNKCDYANRTLVLIKSGNGRRFGGYTTCNWKGNSIDKKDDNAFVFSLDKMQIYDIIPGELAIGCYPKYGPVFLGCQIRIYDDFFTKGGTTFEKGLNYNTQEDYELTGGLKKFDVKEIEVYSIELQ